MSNYLIEKPYNSNCISILASPERNVIIFEEDYDQFVTELELKARELWPEHFTPRTLNDWHKEFVNVEREDGETDTLTAEEARRLDLRFRQQQIPINSKGTK